MAKPQSTPDFLSDFEASYNAPKQETSSFLSDFEAQYAAKNPQAAKEPGFFENLYDLGVSGTKSALTAAEITPTVLGGKAPEESAGAIAKELTRVRPKTPKELKEAQEAFADEAKMFEEAPHWYSPKALQAQGGMLLEFGKQILTNPKGAAYITAESAANMAPAIVGMIAGSRTGAAIGQFGGIYAPATVPAGAVIGGIAGGFTGQVPMETGSEFIGLVGQELQARGMEPNEANVKALLQDKKFTEKAISEARTKGITTAAVDSLTTMVGGRIATGPKRAAVEAARAELGAAATAEQLAKRSAELLKDRKFLEKASAVAKGVGVDVAGGGASEAAGQLAAYGKVDLADVGQEMLGELGGSAIEIPAAGYSALAGAYKGRKEAAAEAGAPPVPPTAPQTPIAPTGEAIVTPEQVEPVKQDLVEVRPNVFVLPTNPELRPADNFNPVYENGVLIGWSPTPGTPTPESVAEPVTITPDIVTTEQNQPLTETAPPVAKESTTGLGELGGGAAQAIKENLYGGLFEALQQGKTKFAGIEDPVLARAKPYFDAGMIKSPDDLQNYENNGYPKLEAAAETKAPAATALPPGFEQFEQTNADGTITSGIRRIETPAAAPAPVDPAVVADAWNSESKLLAETSNAPVVEFEKLPADLQQRIADTYAKDGKLGAKNMVQFMPEVEQFKEPVKEPVAEVKEEPVKDQAEINRERQQAKKAAAEEEQIVTAIRDMAYNKKGMSTKATADDFIAKYGRKFFDRAVELDLLNNEPGKGRLFASNRYVYEVRSKYYDSNFKKIPASQRAALAGEEAPVAKKTQAPRVSKEEIDKGNTDVAPRLERHRDMLKSFLPDFGWATEGGKIIKDFETGEVTGRTQWLPKSEYLDSVRESLGRSYTEMKASAEKALAGERLTAKQLDDINAIMDLFDELSPEAKTDEEVNAELAMAAAEELETTPFVEEYTPPETLELQGQTEEEIAKAEKAKEAARKAEAEQEAKAKAQDTSKDFVLAGSDRDVDQAAARGAQDLFAEKPKVTSIPTETGGNITNKVMVDTVNEGYEMLPLDDERTYKAAGKPVRTFTDNKGVTIALDPQTALAVQRNRPEKGVQVYSGDTADMTVRHIHVDKDKRKTGAATRAMEALIKRADKHGTTLYIEPAQLEKDGITKEQLKQFYSKFGFEPQWAEDGRVLVRKPAAETIPKKTAVQELADNFAPTESKKISDIKGVMYTSGAPMESGWSVVRGDASVSLVAKVDPNDTEYTVHVWKHDPKSKADQLRADAQALMWAELNEIKPAKDNFTNNISMKDIKERTVEVRDEIITEYAGVKKRISTATKKVAKTGGTLDLQRRLSNLLNYADVLKNAIEASKPANNSAEYFMARATKELAAENITPEVEAVIRRIYDKFPNLLEGLRLSVRNPKGGIAAGNFSPINNLVTLWNGTAGVTDPETVRHEIMHSLEKMMTPAARIAVVKEWADALEAAMKKYTGPREAAYFEAVLEFLENPTKETYDRATKIMPSIDLYQYLNPSEYWAVNAEKLFAAKLGTPWNRFVLAVNKLFETMKSLFGFRSKIAVHKAFNNLINNERTDEGQMLTTYFTQTNAKIDFLNNVQEDRDLVEEYDVPEVPAHEVRSKKDMLIAGWKKVQRLAEDIAKEPKVKTVQALNTAGDKITQARIDAVWLGAGLDQADLKRYQGQVRTANGQAVASLAVKNAIHAGNISTQVIIQGGMEYSQKFLQFVAVKRDKSMANVVLLQAKLRDKLGTVLADKIVNAYFAARRTRGIQNEYLDALAAVEDAKVVLSQARMSGIEEDITKAEAEAYQAAKRLQNVKVAYEKAPAYLCVLDEEEPTTTVDGKTIPNVMYDEDGLPVLNDEAIDAFIARDKEHPELKEMMDNWTAVNHNMLDMMAFSGRISKKEAERLKAIKDYSPWYRIMDEQEDIYDSSKMSTITSGIKHFKPGRTERDIDNVVESMLHNVTMMTRSSIRTFANNRVVMEYAERRPDTVDKKTGKKVQGKIRVYSQEGKDESGVRLPIFMSGQRIIVKIPDSQVADAILGLALGPFESKILDALSGSANFLRRSITFSGYFQLKQVFYDAPTAAWVSGVKNPFKLWAECFGGFARAVVPFKDDATVELLRAAGIGGFQSHYRTAKKELNIELGAMSHSNFSRALKLIDHIGDASDYSQRIAVYDRVVKETGDPALAMMQAADIIDFQKHGKSRFAQAFRSTVSFMQAWATQLDALTQASIGKNIKGKKRTEAVQQFYWTATKLASVSLLYAMLAGGDDDYHELDDETKARNFYIPFSKKMYGHHILIPMHTTASLFWKVLPETLHYKFSTEGTANEMDGRRFRHLMSEMAMDSILGPNPIPSLIKPLIEVKFNHNFFTGGNLTPRSLEGLDAAEQYNASTSELGKFISKITAYAGGDGEPEKRLITPIEGDHLARGYAGSIATLSMWASNVMFPEGRVAPQAKDNPFLGGLMGADVQRKNESLVYELMDENEKYFNTFKKLKERGDPKADQYLADNINQIKAYKYGETVTKGLQDLNKEIRRVGESRDASFTPEQRRDRINKLKEIKENQAMAGVIEFRKLADR